MFVGWLLNVPATCGSAQTISRAATLRYKLQTKLSISPSLSILTPGQPEKSLRKRDSNPGSSALEADALTTRPTRLFRERDTHGSICAFPLSGHNDNDNNDCIERHDQFKIFTISSLRRELFPARTLKWPGRNCVQITCNTSGAHDVQHVVCHVVRRDRTAIKFDKV